MNINYFINLKKKYKIIIFLIIIIFIFMQKNKFVVFLLTVVFLLYVFIILFNNKTNNHCRYSTINNPFGNILLYSQLNKYDNKLCPKQKNIIHNNLKYNIYNDASDIFQTKNNIRSFYPMPSQSHPNNINNFTSFLYNFNNKTCKENNNECLLYSDIRYNK